MRAFYSQAKAWIGGLIGGRSAAPAAWSRQSWREPPSANAKGIVALYNRSPELRRVVRRVSNSIGSNAWELKRSNKVVENPTFARVWDRPNPHMSGSAWRALDQIYLDILGETFGVVMMGDAGLEYYPVPPFAVEVLEDERFAITLGQTREIFGEDEVVWIRHLNPLDPYGRGAGDGQALVDEIESAEYAAKHSKAFFYNNATPELLFSTASLKQDQLDRASESYNQRNAGFRNAWRAAFLSGDWKVERLTSEFGKLGMSDYRRYLSDVIRQVYGVPPEIVGQLDQSNRATITAAELIYAKHVLTPRLRFLRAEYQAKLLPKLALEAFTLSFESPIPEDREFQLAVAEAFPWAFTVNELRGLAGHPRLVGGDQFLRQGEWEAVQAGQIIEIGPSGKAVPPPIPRDTIIQFRAIDGGQEVA